MKSSIPPKLSKNAKCIYRALLSNGASDRQSLILQTNLKKMAVASSLAELFDASLVESVGHGESTKKGGRKPIQIAISPEAGYIINVELGYSYLDFMINRLDSSIVSVERYSVNGLDASHQFCMIESLIRTGMSGNMALVGISIAVHTYIHNRPSNQLFENTDLSLRCTDRLMLDFGVPVLIRNFASLSALHELHTAETDNASALMTVCLDSHLIAGVLSRDQQSDSTQTTTSSLGLSITNVGGLSQSTGTSIYDSQSFDQLLRFLRARYRDSDFDLENFIQTYRVGNEEAKRDMGRFTDDLAICIFNTLNIVNSRLVILNSNVFEEIPELSKHLHNVLKRLDNHLNVQVRNSNNQKHSALLGGYDALIDELF